MQPLLCSGGTGHRASAVEESRGETGTPTRRADRSRAVRCNTSMLYVLYIDKIAC